MKRILILFVFSCFILQINLFAQDVIKRVLLEEFSTAPCGFCPEGSIIAEQLLEKYPNLISFTHHAGFGVDSMTIPESKTIANLYTNFAPAGVIDKGRYDIPVYTYPDYIGVSRQKWDSVVAVKLSENAEADVKINKEYDNSTRLLNVTVDVKFLKTLESNDYRFNIAIVEDSVSGIGSGWDQKNYFNDNPSYPTLYKKGDPYIGYIHRHVVRALPTGAWGTAGNLPNIPEVNKTYSYKLTNFKVPATWKEKDINLVAYISYYNTDKFKHKVLNSCQMKLTEGNNTDVENKSNDLSESNDLVISPNPVSYYMILSNQSENNIIEIYSIYGNKLFESYYNEKIDVSYLPQGIYFLVVKNNDKIQKKNFIIVR